ncbi:MAG: GNAT family N-acetyltransferase [Alphaproteobacteria bacterium]|nr:GNAT family N-acetyltransferase [Alphaproteobacteria bacterium]
MSVPSFTMEGTMVQIIVGAFNPNAREQLADMFRQRAKVFVEEMGWPLKTYNGLEFDQYDDADTIYVLEYEKDELVASMRMNPTHRRCMLPELFQGACEGEAPRGPDVWELSRGALAKNLRKSGYWGRIQCAFFEAALLWNARKAIGFFTVDHIMKQMRVGLDIKPLGQPRIVDGEANVAAEFPFNVETLLRLRKSYRIAGPVIEHIYHMPREERAAA